MTLENVNVSSGEKYLKLQIVENGFNIKKITFETLAGNDPDKIISNQFRINKIYPNPFNPRTTIDFSIGEKDQYKIQILNLVGKEINELSNKEFKAGNHSLFWNGDDNLGCKVSSGVYIVKVSGNQRSIQNKVVLLK